MFSCKKIISCLALIALLSSFAAAWKDDVLEPSMPKARAPLDVRKGAMPMATAADASELSGEFGGILYMGQRAYQYERWPGKEMADCQSKSAGSLCGECRLIMGHANADYYFYRNAQQECTLQQVDAQFQASDPALLRTFRRTAQPLLGSSVKGSKPASNEPGWEGSGHGWKWEDSTDLAYLYMDTEQGSYNGEGIARFQWRRTPLFRPSR